MRLLIAEDDPKLLKSLLHIFAANKFGADGVTDGREALLYAQTTEYDGLVLDIMMPGLDGIEVLRTLRKQGVTTPALFLTARTEVAQRVEGLDAGRGLGFSARVEPGLTYTGDEALIRRLLSILLDNAVKYCDPGGQITVRVFRRRHPVLTVENSFAGVDALPLDRLFDRFYRADKARTFSGSFGVGLSIARSIARNHRGSITAYKGAGIIGFRADLK